MHDCNYPWPSVRLLSCGTYEGPDPGKLTGQRPLIGDHQRYLYKYKGPFTSL